MANIQSMAEARKRVRDAQVTVQEERAQKERDNVEDMATFLVSRTRLAGVDAWEAERVAQVAAEAARRRDEHCGAAAAALVRMRDRGETISAIAALAETTESELKIAGARGGGDRGVASAPHALGAEGGGAGTVADAAGGVGDGA